jgi:hypothetical protein
MAKTERKPTKNKTRDKILASTKLDEMIDEATVDAHDESELVMGFYNMFEDSLAVPFQTEVLGVEVMVEQVEMTDDDQLVAVCARGKTRQRVPILDLPLPDPPPEGAEWIDAFRRWKRRS